MNDDSQVEDSPAPVPVSVGQTLRDAREAQGMALEDAAVRLRLMYRQVAAMEADDFVSLGQPVFARGFVRNYARLLGIAPETLLARMEGAPAESEAVIHAELPPQRSWLSSPWVLLLLLGVLLMVAVPVGLYWWLNSDVDDSSASSAPVRQSRPAPQPRPAPAAVPAPAVVLPVIPPPAAPDGLPPPVNGVVEPAATVTPAAPVTPAVPVAPVAPPVSGSALHLEFGAETWAEIKDASGQMLLRRLSPAGSSVDIQGQPPFEMVIGNAAQARLTYNGRPIDLKPYIDVTVARLTLK